MSHLHCEENGMTQNAMRVDDTARPAVTDIGTIEGYFVAIDLQNRKQARLSDALTGESIPCDVEEEQLDDIWHWMRRRVRVGVTGPISYDANGTALRLEAQRLRPIDVEKAVGVEEVIGIFNRAGYAKPPD